MVPTGYVLVLAAVLFLLGLVGVVLRRNVIIVMMSVELMLNGVNMTLIGFARARGEMFGQAFSFMIIALAAAEAAVGLAILVAIFRTRRTVNVDEISLMRH
ncbi:MAG: NADH-quinone oxidoreductase subunit NuoK [Deltaproteobacteria bacterium]|nr:NADH-quinone oxidoreductase subunit NuoK [Deltaproteobacteria bacterium]